MTPKKENGKRCLKKRYEVEHRASQSHGLIHATTIKVTVPTKLTVQTKSCSSRKELCTLLDLCVSSSSRKNHENMSELDSEILSMKFRKHDPTFRIPPGLIFCHYAKSGCANKGDCTNKVKIFYCLFVKNGQQNQDNHF